MCVNVGEIISCGNDGNRISLGNDGKRDIDISSGIEGVRIISCVVVGLVMLVSICGISYAAIAELDGSVSTGIGIEKGSGGGDVEDGSYDDRYV